jgi:hypothetical protein
MTSTTTKKATAADIVAMLQRHYLPEGRPPGGILAVEIGAPDGTRRADALWAPLTLSGGDLVGHEVKVSRSDVLAELADPTKADPWLRYCSRWWLTVSDPALVEGLDIPEAWGIMAPPSGRRTRSMTIVRDAPKRKVGDTGPAWRRILAWSHYRTAERLTRLEAEVGWRQRDIDRLEEELQTRRLAGEGQAHPHAVRVSKIVRALEEAARGSGRRVDEVWLHGDEITDGEVVTALLDLARLRAISREAGWKLDRMVEAVEEFKDPMAETSRRLAALRQERAS